MCVCVKTGEFNSCGAHGMCVCVCQDWGINSSCD